MATLQVRDVPEHIHRRLVQQAAAEHRSLSKQTISVLAKGLDLTVDPKARRRRVLDEITKLNLGARTKWPDFVKMIREDRAR